MNMKLQRQKTQKKSSQVKNINVFHSISTADEIVKPERYSNWLRLVRVFIEYYGSLKMSDVKLSVGNKMKFVKM